MLCLNANGLSSSRLSDDAREVPPATEAADARTDGLEPLRFRSTPRCASRGVILTFGEYCLLAVKTEIWIKAERKTVGEAKMDLTSQRDEESCLQPHLGAGNDCFVKQPYDRMEFP
jgi:hypothetical protein